MYFEDFEVGDVYEHRPGRTITETDNIWQSLINLNRHPLHIDAEYGRASEFGRSVVSSLVTFAVVGGLSMDATIAHSGSDLEWRDVRLPAPVFVGDTLYAETTVLAKRQPPEHPGRGVVCVETRGYKQDGTLCLTAERDFLVPCRQTAAEAAT
jgi:itaconyl-CoA hydratase